MGHIRPLVPDDLENVVKLYRRTSERSSPPAESALRPYFHQLFFKNPWYDLSLPSLVYEDDSGELVGFLGIIPRRMLKGGQPITAAVGNHFVVESGQRHSLAAVHLLREFLSGPQDLSIAEGNDSSRKLWETLGGVVSIVNSIHYRWPLRPGRYLSEYHLGRGKLPFYIRWVAVPMLAAMDVGATRFKIGPFQQRRPAVLKEEASPERLLSCVEEFTSERYLRPVYDLASFKWLLEMLETKKKYGTLRKVLVKSPRDEVLGWYLYYSNPGGLCQVVQVGATPGSATDVLECLCYDAWQEGALVLSGRLQPAIMKDFLRKPCLLNCDGGWMLVQAKDRGLLDAINRGDAFLTRMEGEWWIPFYGDRYDFDTEEAGSPTAR